MDNKLSELSKPVRINHDWNRALMCHCGKCDQWEMTVADADGIQTCASCYDAEWLSEWQNYAEVAEQRVCAMLAELGSKSAYAADWCHLATKRKDELDDANKRIAELERANKAQDDHINQQQDRIDSLEKTNAGLGRRLGYAEKRLATPVRLPARKAVRHPAGYPEDAAREAGYNEALFDIGEALDAQGFTVEGDE